MIEKFENKFNILTPEYSDQKIENPKEKILSSIDGNNNIEIRYIDEPEAKKPKVEIFIKDSNTGKEVLDFSRVIERKDDEPTIQIKSGEHFATVSPDNIVSVPIEKLSDPREVFSLLHELGHIVDYRDRSGAKEEEEERQKLLNKLVNEMAMAETAQSAEIYSTLTDIIGHDIKDAMEIMIRQERNAWADAIKLARQIQKTENINLFKIFSDSNEFMGWLRHKGLRTYEQILESSGIPAFTKNKQVDQWLRKEYEEEIRKWNRELDDMESPLPETSLKK